MMLGNLSVAQMEKRMGITFPIELKEILYKYHQENVSMPIADGFWHCFDMPFIMVCGNNDLASLMVEKLGPLSNKIISPLRISVTEQKHGYQKKNHGYR